MRFFLITCTLLFIGVTGSYSQNRKTVEYDFAKKELRGAIPFDQPFNIKCINVPGDVMDVHVTIFDVNRINYKGKWSRETPLTDKELKANTDACKLLYETERHKRYDDTLNIPILVFLNPNSSYHIEISGNKYIKLDTEEIDRAVDTIMNDKDFADIFSKTFQDLILMPSQSLKWDEQLSAIYNVANIAVKKANQKYVVVNDNKNKQFDRFIQSTEALEQIRDYLNQNKEGFYKDAEAILNQEDGKRPMLLAKNDAKIRELETEINAAKAELKDNSKASKFDTIQALIKEKEKALNLMYSDTNKVNHGKFELSNIKRDNIDVPVSEISTLVEQEIRKIDWFNATKPDLDLSNAFKNDLMAIEISGLDTLEISTIAESAASQFQKDLNKSLDELLEARDQMMAGISVAMTQSVFSFKELGNTYPASLDERFKMHVTLDLGYAYVSRIDRFNLYAGMNIYLRAIDTALPLSNYHGTKKDFIASRTSLLIGVSLSSIKEDGVRRGIISEDMALVTGVGFRLLSFFKINTGAYFFYQYPNNPLVNKKNYHVAAAPFISFSLDFNIASLLQSLGNGHVAKIIQP